MTNCSVDLQTSTDGGTRRRIPQFLRRRPCPLRVFLERVFPLPRNVEDVAPVAEADVGIDLQIQQEDPQLDQSWRRPREEDDESSSKRFRWWDEFADTDSDGGSDGEVSCIEDSDSDDVAIEEEEEDTLPQASRKKEREEEEEEEGESSAKSQTVTPSIAV